MEYGVHVYIAIGLIVLGRILGLVALKQLSEEQRNIVQSVFAKIKGHVLVPVLVLVGVVFFAESFFRANPIYAGIAVGAYLIYLVALHVTTMRKLAEHEIPKEYKFSFLASFYASQAGVVTLLAGYLL